MAGPDASRDRRFMELALALGRRGFGRTWPNPAVGAVVVRDDGEMPVIVGRGWTQPGGRPHAETQALDRARAAAAGATLYATLEPCAHHGKTPPCVDAIIGAGIVRVVSALEDPNAKVAGRGHAQLRASGVAVDIGVGAEEARRVHAGHIRRVHDARPHVVLKLAISADGKVGRAGGAPVAVTGAAARQRVHLMRAMNDAILIGRGTALADDPLLTCRLPGMQGRSPVRVVLDSALRLPPTCRLVASAGDTPLWVFACHEAAPEDERRLREAGAHVFRVGGGAGGLDPRAVLHAIADRGITRLMIEGGPHIATTFLAADLVDECVVMRAPMRIGEAGIDALVAMRPGVASRLDDFLCAPRMRRRATCVLGEDQVEIFERM